MDKDKVFNQPTYDLGTDIKTRQDVSQHFLQSYMALSSNEKCCKCNSSYVIAKLIPKDPIKTPVPDKDGYVCQHCVKLFDTQFFKLKDLRDDKGGLV